MEFTILTVSKTASPYNKDTEYFFELNILVDEITKDVSLMVTDFADKEELSEAKQLWENQILDLKHVIGSV